MLLTTNILTKKQDSSNRQLGIKGILFSHETTIIGKQVENLIKASYNLIKKQVENLIKIFCFLNLNLFSGNIQ